MNEEERIRKRWEYMINDSCKGNKSAFARLLKMTPQSFQQYYNGERMAGWDILKRILALGYSLNWFMIGVGKPKLNDLNNINISSIEVNRKRDAKSEQEAQEYVDELYSAFEGDDLNAAETQFLAEIKQFSLFLETRPLNPHVKRLLLELLIESIDQAIEQPQHGPAPSAGD